MDLWICNRNGPQIRYLQNNADPGQKRRFIRVRLQGTRSNRDGVGAIISGYTNDPLAPITRTVQAGHGYLSQGSKWIHIGLGEQRQLNNMTVTWPGGEQEVFGDLPAGESYLLVQDSGHAQRVTRQRRVALPAEALTLPRRTEQAAVRLAARLPVPQIRWQSQGSIEQLAFAPNVSPAPTATLVLLWASWCGPCVQELTEWTAAEKSVRAADLDVLALSVDTVATGPSRPTGETTPDLQKIAQAKSRAEQLLQEVGFPYRAGFALPSTITAIQLTHDYLFGLEKPLPIPAAMLVDARGHVLAVYRGATNPSRVIEDWQAMRHATKSSDRRVAAQRFPGIWLGGPRTLPLEPFVKELVAAGEREVASEYVQRNQARFQPASLLALLVQLGTKYYEAGETDRAERHFQMARRVAPQTVGPELSVGRYLQHQGRFAEAAEQYRLAYRTNRRSVEAINNLAWLLATCPDDTVRDSQQALQLIEPVAQRRTPPHPALLDTYAAALAESGRFDQAANVAKLAVDAAIEHGMRKLARDIEARRSAYLRHQPFRLPVTKRDSDLH